MQVLRMESFQSYTFYKKKNFNKMINNFTLMKILLYSNTDYSVIAALYL